MSRYPFPNVPQLPGVPQLTRSNLFPTTTPPGLGSALALGRLALALTRDSGWGIYIDHAEEDAANRRENDRRRMNGERPVLLIRGAAQPVLVPDSFVDFGQRNEWSITDAPTESGGFASYNKVNNPYEVQLRLAKGGSLRERTDFLEKLQQIAEPLTLYRVVTPERTYFGLNIARFEISRKQGPGAYFLAEVDVFFRQIRTVVSQYTTTVFDTSSAQQASAEPLKNLGVKQAVEVPAP